MNILLDVTSLMRRDLTGIGVYVKNLFDHLRAQPGVDVHGRWRLSRFAKRDLIARHIGPGAAPYLPLLSGLNPRGYAIYHGPDFRIPARGRFRKVVTIHDLVIHEPDLVDTRFASEGIEKMRRTLLECAPARIITVSEFTRTRLLEHYPQLEPITRTVPLGVDATAFSAPRGADMLDGLEPGSYLLSVGSVEKRKNLANTVRAFEIVRREHPGLTLVVAGGAGHGAEAIDAMIARSPAAAAIKRLGFIDNERLVALYQHAACFLYPSLYEGFGLPILEAMAAGAPVVTSAIGAMAEVSGQAALLADPHNPGEIAARVLDILSSPERRASLARAGRERAAHYTWPATAAATLEVYREAME